MDPTQPRRLWLAASLVLCTLLCAGCASMQSTPKKSAAHRPGKADAQVELEELETGSGEKPKEGQTVVMEYVGRLTNGKQFDSTADHGKPFEMVLGKGDVIKGWDIAVAAMQAGGKYKVTVPPEFGYGSKEHGDIPANSTLIFEIEVLEIKSGKKSGGKHAHGGGGRGGGHGRRGGMGGGMP